MLGAATILELAVEFGVRTLNGSTSTPGPGDAGGERVALRLRRATDTDCDLLFAWVNDPAVRAGSFAGTPVSYEAHVEWFRSKIGNPDCELYILLDDEDRPVGQVRFDIRPDGSAEVAVSMDASCRNRGYGTAALRLGCERLLQIRDTHTIFALVRPENVASVRAFAKAGFMVRRVTTVGHAAAVEMSFTREPGGGAVEGISGSMGRRSQ